jgi:hypothetical protein
MFHFYTDVNLLAIQTPSDSFGAAVGAATTGKDSFRVADVHQSSGTVAAKAYAVCRGQVCVQIGSAAGGVIQSLNLILRPLVQPPFDFPYVEYFIYRGLDPATLIAAPNLLDLSCEEAGADRNALIGYIREKVLKFAAPQGTQESGDYLGLDRLASAPAGHWGDDQPLDHLFRYAGGAELPIVEPGWTLGTFLPTFGFEVVVQQYGAQPRTDWVRRDDGWIEATPFGGTTTDYACRLEREAIGAFVDPCAFWGMFYGAGLRFPDDLKRGAALRDRLFGTAPKIFSNGARAYLDVRNEIGLSGDFYASYRAADGTGMKLGPDETGLVARPFGTANWPIAYIDPAPSATLCFRVRRDAGTAPLLYLRQAGAPLSARDRFRSGVDSTDTQWTAPVTLRRPVDTGDTGAPPPYWFVVHYLRGDVSTATPSVPAGAFDTSPLQFGPIADRLVAAYRELWPSSGGGAAITTTGYQRRFVTDKVLRHDGTVKIDPADTSRSIAYDGMVETSYVLQRGTGANATKNSIIAIQRRSQRRKRIASGDWDQTKGKLDSSSGGLLLQALSGEALQSQIEAPAALGAGEVLKAAIFDFTFLMVGKAAIDPAIVAAAPAATPAAPGESHPIFLSLGPPAISTATHEAQADLVWRGWDGQHSTGPTTGAQVSSKSGIFFRSADFDESSLASLAPALTNEELEAAPLWDGFIAKDTMAAATGLDPMPLLAKGFVDAVLAVDPAPSGAPGAALLAIVEDYGARIWARAVQLAHSSAYEEWSDLALYYARLKMGVALKSHQCFIDDPVTSLATATRFDRLSRNFTGLQFAGNSASRVLLTGFDPYGIPKQSNPSGRLALRLSGYEPPDLTIQIRTCIFPTRWDDFNAFLVESVVDDALAQNSNGIDLICTCSLEPWIKYAICGVRSDTEYAAGIKPFSDLHVRIDRFAGKCRTNGLDNDLKNPSPENLSYQPAGIPRGLSAQDAFYETKLIVSQGGSPIDLATTDATCPIKIRYNDQYIYSISGSTVPAAPASDLPSRLSRTWTLIETQHISYPAFPVGAVAIKGSGGNFLSNEIYYRVSNLIQSTTYTTPQPQYQPIKNGHIHLPNLGKYVSVPATGQGILLGEAKLDDLLPAIFTVIYGVIGP